MNGRNWGCVCWRQMIAGYWCWFRVCRSGNHTQKPLNFHCIRFIITDQKKSCRHIWTVVRSLNESEVLKYKMLWWGMLMGPQWLCSKLDWFTHCMNINYVVAHIQSLLFQCITCSVNSDNIHCMVSRNCISSLWIFHLIINLTHACIYTFLNHDCNLIPSAKCTC